MGGYEEGKKKKYITLEPFQLVLYRKHVMAFDPAEESEEYVYLKCTFMLIQLHCILLFIAINDQYFARHTVG